MLALSLFLPAPSFAAKGVAKRIEEKIGLDEDATLQERVDLIGQKVAAACDRKAVVYTFKVLKGEDKVNAFALPDGYIYLYRGLVDKLERDDEIAAVIAHEIAHIAARHHEERMRRNILADVFRLVSVSNAETYADKRMINQAVVELTLSYSREEEIEADTLSVEYLKNAGYDPEAILAVIDVLIRSELEGPIKAKRRFRTHPYLNDRIKAAREEILGYIDFMDYANTPTHGVER